jgi:hypothetical protein
VGGWSGRFFATGARQFVLGKRAEFPIAFVCAKSGARGMRAGGWGECSAVSCCAGGEFPVVEKRKGLICMLFSLQRNAPIDEVCVRHYDEGRFDFLTGGLPS